MWECDRAELQRTLTLKQTNESRVPTLFCVLNMDNMQAAGIPRPFTVFCFTSWDGFVLLMLTRVSTLCRGCLNDTVYYSTHNLSRCLMLSLYTEYKTLTRSMLLFNPQSADVFFGPREVGGLRYLMFQPDFLSYNMFLNYVSQGCLTFCPVHYQSSFTSRLTQTGTRRQTLSLQLHAFFMSASPFM